MIWVLGALIVVLIVSDLVVTRRKMRRAIDTSADLGYRKRLPL